MSKLAAILALGAALCLCGAALSTIGFFQFTRNQPPAKKDAQLQEKPDKRSRWNKPLTKENAAPATVGREYEEWSPAQSGEAPAPPEKAKAAGATEPPSAPGETGKQVRVREAGPADQGKKPVKALRAIELKNIKRSRWNWATHKLHQLEFAYGAESDFNSAYVWRGIVLNDRPVTEPSVWISASRFTLTAWSHLAMTSTPESTRLQTAGLTLTYGRDWKKLRIEPTIEAYLNPWLQDVTGRNTIEGSLKLSYRPGPFRVFTSHAFDILSHRGSYFGEAGLGYEGQVTKRMGLAVYVRSGWASSKFNDVYIGLNKAAFNFIGAESALTYYLRPYLYFRPHLEFSNITDRRLRENLTSPTFANFGLAMGVEF